MTWMLFDWLGTVAFAVSGAMVGLSKRMDIFGVVVLAVLTAVGGGMVRDLMAQKVPVVLRMDVYAVASLVGAFVMCTAWPYGADGASWIGFFVVLLLRACAIHFGWQLYHPHPKRSIFRRRHAAKGKVSHSESDT